MIAVNWFAGHEAVQDFLLMPVRVFVVDDSAFTRRTMRQHLEALEYAVDEANSGQEALERIYLKPPQLVILDLVMPGMYGLDVLKTLGKLCPTVPVIISTADIQTTTANEAQAAGAYGVLSKPVRRAALAAAIETVLRGRKMWS